MRKKKVLSGIRPTGKLHIGHWAGVLSNWVELQEKYDCFFMVADWHALMSEYKNSGRIKSNIIDNVADWISWGIDPDKSVVFVQSDVSEHIELFMFLSVLTPLGWLSRCPTFKEQLKQLKDKDINTYAFLGYPALQASDILIYKANYVPVGEDQLPHLEITREIARRFHSIYKRSVFVEPQPLLTKAPKLLGIDNRKMSKSYNNFISLDEDDSSIETKIVSMFTDPLRLRKKDAGHPDTCNVFSYYKTFAPDLAGDVRTWCVNAGKGCRECKEVLAKKLIGIISDKRRRKKELLRDEDFLPSVLRDGARKARSFASRTLAEAKEAVYAVRDL
ncbi:MAG: tryptophan--tRNA ligase [Candidatus Omnitrophica bacterium 4484_171]|nr:MAG: tryptophan--tRNA ligase [Candidatus Omnitrophica bacterium 4484_171]